ncbi:MAG: TonB-dependent receptor [Bacteroidaceae bacterium]|nr:TonB-dependent receptor [Bacteroidaceae bacterium]
MKNLKLGILAAILTLCGTTSLQAETLRGKVTDARTGEPLIGALVRIVELTNVAALADTVGDYEITIHQPGRYTVETNYIGYEPSVTKEVQVVGVKEVVLDIALRENANQLSEIVIKPRVNKMATVNATTLVGGVMLSMEEASRFAGGYNDPARLVTAYAGVAGQGDGNGISVYGNAPQTMQYRLEGVEIFTPNHFSDLYSGGFGLVSALNANVIGNSDFFTSAFNASYSNSLSGVFDIKMRPGNNAKYENIVQLGTVSMEWTSEGPISRKHNSSYIFNYRYGFSSLANKIGILDAMGTNFDFMDCSMKLNFPTKKAGTFSIFALGFYDKANDKVPDLEDVHSIYDVSNDHFKMWNFVVGASHKVYLGHKWTWRNTLAYNMQHDKLNTGYRYFDTDATTGAITRFTGQEAPFYHLKQNEDRIVYNTEFSKQLTSQWLTQFGGEYSQRFFDISFRQAPQPYATIPTAPLYDVSDDTGLANLHWSNVIRPTENLSVNLGIAANYFLLSKDFSAEPRASMKWDFSRKDAIALGYGLHSMAEKLDTYFLRDEEGNLVNKHLKMGKAHHLLATYTHQFTSNLNMRVNAYYQYGYDTPVSADATRTYCVTNREHIYVDEALVNKGNTRNYGIDMTLEHYMSHGFFGQTNFSLFRSEYRAQDRVWHHQLYDRGYMLKFLGGKEWMVGSHNQNVFNISAKYTVQGGLRHTPIDLAATIANGINADEPVFIQQEAMSKQYKPTHLVDLTVSYKWNKKKVSHTLAFEGINILMNETPYAERYDFALQRLRYDKSGISLPNLYYRLDF